jgi:2,4-dienoyl-CoA reductase-like NADH-dependent reductase (Old Yellow Enzyme family)
VLRHRDVIGFRPHFDQPASRERAGVLTGAVGLITEAEQAEAILAAGEADAIFLGRELLRNPYWPRYAQA